MARPRCRSAAALASTGTRSSADHIKTKRALAIGQRPIDGLAGALGRHHPRASVRQRCGAGRSRSRPPPGPARSPRRSTTPSCWICPTGSLRPARYCRAARRATAAHLRSCWARSAWPTCSPWPHPRAAATAGARRCRPPIAARPRHAADATARPVHRRQHGHSGRPARRGRPAPRQDRTARAAHSQSLDRSGRRGRAVWRARSLSAVAPRQAIAPQRHRTLAPACAAYAARRCATKTRARTASAGRPHLRRISAGSRSRRPRSPIGTQIPARDPAAPRPESQATRSPKRVRQPQEQRAKTAKQQRHGQKAGRARPAVRGRASARLLRFKPARGRVKWAGQLSRSGASANWIKRRNLRPRAARRRLPAPAPAGSSDRPRSQTPRARAGAFFAGAVG